MHLKSEPAADQKVKTEKFLEDKPEREEEEKRRSCIIKTKHSKFFRWNI